MDSWDHFVNWYVQNVLTNQFITLTLQSRQTDVNLELSKLREKSRQIPKHPLLWYNNRCKIPTTCILNKIKNTQTNTTVKFENIQKKKEKKKNKLVEQTQQVQDLESHEID